MRKLIYYVACTVDGFIARELILKVNPVVIGTGIQLFKGSVETTTLGVIASKGYSNGFRLTHYRVKH